MKLEELIDKKISVKVIGLNSNKKYFISESAYGKVYIENTDDYDLEEINRKDMNCLIVDVRNNKLVGFFLADRKFKNDINRIEELLRSSEEYDLIEDIYLSERIKLNGKVFGLYVVDLGEYGKYYLDTIEIGHFSKKIMNSNIVFKNKTIEEEIGKQIRDIIQSIDVSKKEISLEEEQKHELDLIEEALGLTLEKEITGVLMVDLRQKIKEEKEEKEEKIQEGQIRENQLAYKKIMDMQKKEGSIKDVNIKQELKMNSMVTDMKTLGQLLEKNKKLPHIEGKKFIKMGVIESDQRDNLYDKNGKKAKVNTTRYSFVAIARDGTVVPMELSQDYQEGRNPTEINYQVTQKGKIIQDDVLSRFNIGNGTFAVKNGQYGEIKVYHSPRKTIGGNGIEGNKSLDRELETNNVWIMKKQERDLAGEFKLGYRSVENSYQEAKKHEDEKGKIKDNEKIEISDIDGDKNTKTHEHLDYNNLAIKWGYYVDNGIPNSKKAEELFEQKQKENPNKTEKEIVEMVTEEIDEQMRISRARKDRLER